MAHLSIIEMKSFKTKNKLGTVKTMYAIYNNGVVHVEQRALATKKPKGWTVLYKRQKVMIVYRDMGFKLDSFLEIMHDVVSFVKSDGFDDNKILKPFETYKKQQNDK